MSTQRQLESEREWFVARQRFIEFTVRMQIEIARDHDAVGLLDEWQLRREAVDHFESSPLSGFAGVLVV